MKLPKNALVAVADGETLKLYRNTSDEGSATLTALPDADVSTSNKGSGGRHQSSSAIRATASRTRTALPPA